MNVKYALCALLFIGGAVPVLSKPPVWPQLGVETQIVFPNYGAIQNFEADDDDGLWIEDSRRRWYYAKLFGPCHGLNFAHGIGFDTRGSPRFDKFSSILVNGQDCKLESLVTAEKPLSRKERRRLAKEAKAAR
jgi:hypothetical protein